MASQMTAMANRMVVLLLSLWLTCDRPTQSARILAVLPVMGKSHHLVLHAILKAVVHAGHQVVVYSPFPLDNPPPNYTNVYLDSMVLEDDSFIKVIQDITKAPQWKCLDVLFQPNITELTLQSFFKNAKIKNLLSSNEKFDLVFTEAFTGQEHILVLGHIFKAPVIALQVFVTNSIVNINSGNTNSISYIPDTCFTYSNKMTFLERVLNYFTILRGFYLYNNHLTAVDGKIKALFTNIIPLKDLVNNVSLTFTNSHVTADYSQPLTPNIIHIGGIHIAQENPLPQDIKTFMDDATDGVILFSLGTYVPDNLEPKEYFDMFINVFKKLRQRVLWKTRMENIKGLPENVMALKWMPQQDILAHPKCVLFITHCGLLSTHETVHFAVPVIGIPQFFDQHRNARYLEEQEVGVRLERNKLSEEALLESILTVLGEDKYRSNMKRLSRIFKDRPMTPAQTVVFWTEYVLRHGGAPHLKPASTLLSWYQLTLLDVVAAIIAVFIILMCVLYLTIRILSSILGKIRTKTGVSLEKKSN